MPDPSSLIELLKARHDEFELLKRRTPIAIYGSFYRDRRGDLVRLRDYLRGQGYAARISEDLDDGTGSEIPSIRDRELSERLIDESTAHIFVMPRRRPKESDTLIQSVSMELERLCTLIECGAKQRQPIAVFFEEGLMDRERWGFGGVCRGLLARQTTWTVGEFEHIEDIFAEARSFCMQALWEQEGVE